MNCSLSSVAGWAAAALTTLTSAVVLAWLWVSAVPLFAAAALVATVSLVLIPKMKQALLDYQKCRGNSAKCSLKLGIDNLGMAAAALSAVSFAIAGAMQVAALALIFTWFFAAIGVGMSAAVLLLVKSGTFGCAIAALIIIGVLSNAWAYKKCMDEQTTTGTNTGGVIR